MSWNQEQRKLIAKTYMGVASFFSDRPVEKETITIWMDSLCNDFTVEEVQAALKRWFNDPKATRAPSPGQIREIIQPTPNDRDNSVEAASRILAAVPKFGCQGTSQIRDAKEFIGELGWKAVDRIGGWKYLCENLGTRVMPLNSMQAQLRDACEAVIKMARAGRLELPPGIPKPELTQGEAKDVMKMIEKKTNPPKEGK